MKERMFPIMSEDGIQEIPWSAIEPHRRQAEINHSQSLERLAERGGLGLCEAVAVLEDRRWHPMDRRLTNARLFALAFSQPRNPT